LTAAAVGSEVEYYGLRSFNTVTSRTDSGFEFVGEDVIEQLWRARCSVDEMVEEIDVA
jgi:hypothetical protein